MNIEELELSLRSEFEGQMNNVIARLRQDVTDFQKRFEAEFQRHREEMDRSLDELASRVPESFPLEAAFTSTITEHLRLARDEGAQIAATAFGEAEKMRGGDAGSEGKYDRVRDAINDITSKHSQAAILSALVEHASHFAPRGAFFIVKNDHFVGWRSFGAGGSVFEGAVREVNFTTRCHSVLSEAVGTLSTVRSEFGSYADDCNFLDPLGFGRPTEMYAVPLSARGRGVAVLYADRDGEGSNLNVEALETLVRVAGLTVELLAAQSAKPQVTEARTETSVAQSEDRASSADDATTTAVYEAREVVQEVPAEEQVEEAVPEGFSTAAEPEETKEPEVNVEQTVPSVSYEFESSSTPYEVDANAPAYEFESNGAYEFEANSVPAYEPVEAVEAVHESPATSFAPVEPAVFEVAEEAAPATPEFAASDPFASPVQVESFHTEIPHVGNSQEEAETIPNEYVFVPEPAATPAAPEPAAEAAPSPSAVKPRLSDRNVDLPIEVADEERKLHNDARRFARLLVSEIKLYNEQRVTEGRDNNDLYDRLREAIDRSREMYDKRVKPAVASKFDYFHYELVNGLAESDVKKLGSSYPGPTV